MYTTGDRELAILALGVVSFFLGAATEGLSGRKSSWFSVPLLSWIAFLLTFMIITSWS